MTSHRHIKIFLNKQTSNRLTEPKLQPGRKKFAHRFPDKAFTEGGQSIDGVDLRRYALGVVRGGGRCLGHNKHTTIVRGHTSNQVMMTLPNIQQCSLDLPSGRRQ